MRRLAVILYMLVNVSVLLIPFHTAHAHVSSGTHTDVHGGHSHDFEHSHGAGGAHEPGDAEQVVDLEPALTNQSTSPSPFWTYWLPLACVLAILAAGVQVCLLVLRPPRSHLQSGSHRGYWRPPLRGPPSLSIQAL